jgi:hypothetical protein
LGLASLASATLVLTLFIVTHVDFDFIRRQPRWFRLYSLSTTQTPKMDSDKIIATNGECLESGYKSPGWCCFNKVPFFERQLTHALEMLQDENARRRIYRYGAEADDSPIGHTPPETRARYNIKQQNKIRQQKEYIVPPTRKQGPPLGAARRGTFEYQPYKAPSDTLSRKSGIDKRGFEATMQQQNSSQSKQVVPQAQGNSEAVAAMRQEKEKAMTAVARKTHALLKEQARERGPL